MYDIVNMSISTLHTAGEGTSWVGVDSARILASMVVNLFATLCIGFKAWYDDSKAHCSIHSHHPGNSVVI